MKTINIKLLGYTPPTPQGEKRPSNLELPYGMTLSRFANTHTIELIGKYRVPEYDAEPTRVCHIVIDKPSRSAEIELNQRPLLTITAEHGSPCMLEYIAVKALKGYLQYRIAANYHKMRQRKRRRAEKRAAKAAASGEA